MSFTLAMYCSCSVLAGVASLILPIETAGRGLQESGPDYEAGEQTITRAGQSNGRAPS